MLNTDSFAECLSLRPLQRDLIIAQTSGQVKMNGTSKKERTTRVVWSIASTSHTKNRLQPKPKNSITGIIQLHSMLVCTSFETIHNSVILTHCACECFCMSRARQISPIAPIALVPQCKHYFQSHTSNHLECMRILPRCSDRLFANNLPRP